MAVEFFANDISTTLNGAITSGATSLTVADNTGFPSEYMRIRIDNEIILVTAKSGTGNKVWSIVRGSESTTAAAHSDGATVTHVLTVAALAAAFTRRDSDTAMAARARNSAAASIPDSAVTAVSFDTEDFDTDAFHSNVTDPYKFTAPIAGKYFFSVNGTFAASAGGSVRAIYLVHNGSTTIKQMHIGPSAGFNNYISVTTTYNMAAGDYVYCAVFQNSGGNLDWTPGAFDVFRIA